MLLLTCERTDTVGYLINAGEGLQRFCVEHKMRLAGKLQRVLLTRTTWDTAGGLPGLMLTMLDGGHEDTLRLHGPERLTQLVSSFSSFVTRRALPKQVSETPGDWASGAPQMLDESGISVTPVLLSPYAVPSAGISSGKVVGTTEAAREEMAETTQAAREEVAETTETGEEEAADPLPKRRRIMDSEVTASGERAISQSRPGPAPMEGDVARGAEDGVASGFAAGMASGMASGSATAAADVLGLGGLPASLHMVGSGSGWASDRLGDEGAPCMPPGPAGTFATCWLVSTLNPYP